MSIVTIEQDFHEKVSREIRLAPEGIERFRVSTPFMFDDGDHLAIVLKREGSRWVLSDEAHTFMRLTYDVDEADLQRGTRQKIIADALSAFQIEDRDGELILPVPGERYGDALFSFVQGILKIADVSYLSRQRVRSTFNDDFREFLTDATPDARRSFDWRDPENDPEGRYSVDCRINGMSRPLLVHALPNDGKVRDATITLLQFEKWGMRFRSLAIFEDQESINRKVLARFSDVCENQFSSLAANRERIARFLADCIESA